MPRDPFSVLGVSPGSSDDEIKSAYRRLAKQYHPDLHPNDPTAAARMNEINAAYEQIKSGQTGTYSQPGSNYTYGYSPQWQQDAYTHYTYYSRQSSRVRPPGSFLVRMILAFLIFRLIGSILFGALLGSGTYTYSYEAPRSGSGPGYYYYYAPVPADPKDTM